MNVVSAPSVDNESDEAEEAIPELEVESLEDGKALIKTLFTMILDNKVHEQKLVNSMDQLDCKLKTRDLNLEAKSNDVILMRSNVTRQLAEKDKVTCS